ncbi:MAG: sugar transferase [Clostridia bacterium]|nr:sugar transferase [Clostridia bacterium]
MTRNRMETTKGVSNAYLIAKRSFDIIFSLGAGAVVLIPMLLLMLLITIKDFGNPFYVQKRVGQNGKALGVVKLRSMKKHADDLENMLSPEKLDEYHREYKLDDDPRLLGWKKENDGRECFGAALRRTSMDEAPQIIWNILIKGNMSVVGPRPVLHEELMKNYTSEQRDLLLSIKPGLTGYWQAYARNNATYETGERQRMELYYAENCSLWLDVKIIFATIGAVLRKSGAK